MANDEVLGPRKTMFVLVIVVGCFAVLWPRILSPLLLGPAADQLKPNRLDREAVLKQERPPIRMAPHPALRERGRAIPPGPPPTARPAPLPPHVRVRSPLSVYYELDIKPPPIPGMRPPLGSPGGPVPAPKSSMGFVMPIYTICIIVFFVYTLSKILFKRTGSPYDPVTPDLQFRRRVFRDDSRTSPDTLGHREADTIVSAISGLVAEVQQQMEASYTQNQQRQEAADNARPYTNGTILLNSGPVHIVTSEYREPKEKTPEPQKEPSAEIIEVEPVKSPVETSIEEKVKDPTLEPEKTVDPEKPLDLIELIARDEKESVTEQNEDEKSVAEEKENKEERSQDPEQEIEKPAEGVETISQMEKELEDVAKSEKLENTEQTESTEDISKPVINDVGESSELKEKIKPNEENKEESNQVVTELSEDTKVDKVDLLSKLAEDFLNEEREENQKQKETTPELLEEAIKETSPDAVEDVEDKESQSVKVIGMELTAHPADGGAYKPEPPVPPQPKPHKAEEVKSIFLETEIPQQSRVLVADFEQARDEAKPQPSDRAPLVVSGKITLSLIQDAPRDTPDRDLESTVDDFTTASGLTQPAAEKEDDLSDEEDIEEIEEIEEVEDIEEIEEEEEPDEVEKN